MAAKSGSGSFVWGLLAGGVALIGAGVLYYAGVFGTSPEPAPEPVEQAALPETQTQTAAEPEQELQQESAVGAEEESARQQSVSEPAEQHTAEETPESAAIPAPVLDQIFVERDGSALLSGSAVPGSSIAILVDGAKVHGFTVDGSGEFAEFLSLPFSKAARGLVLESEVDGQVQRSDDYLIAALPEPEAQPEQIASADTETGESAAQEPAAQPAQAETGPKTQAQSTEAPGTQDTTTAGAAEVAQAIEPAESPDTAEATEAADPPKTAGAEQPAQSEAADAPAPEASGQVAILRSGEEGVELVQPPAKREDVPAAQVTLDTIGYSDSGDVQLSGRAQPGAVIRLYLNNRAITDMSASDQGKWRGEIEGIEPGIYTLRLDEIGGDGAVLSRLETPFKRESLEVLQPAAPVVTAEAPTAGASTEASTGTTPVEEAPVATAGAETAAAASQPAPAPAIRAVTVQKGDTLWAISRERYGDGFLYVRVFDANRESIRDPDLIYPGQVFTIPE